MTRRIHRKFIAAIAAASIAITGFSAAPARAGQDEVGAALAALLGLAIVGAVIKDKRDDRKERHAAPQPQVHKPHHKPNHIKRHKQHAHPKPLPHRVSRKLLPQRCLFNLPNDNGRYLNVFGQRCLNRHYQHVASLPQQCGRRVWTQRGARFGYAARCLNKHGYQLARH